MTSQAVEIPQIKSTCTDSGQLPANCNPTMTDEQILAKTPWPETMTACEIWGQK